MQVELAAGKKLSDIAETTRREADNVGQSGGTTGAAIHILGQIWKHGEDLYRFYSKTKLFGNEEDVSNKKGNVPNPAALGIG